MKLIIVLILCVAASLVIADTRSDTLCPGKIIFVYLTSLDYSFWNTQACMPCD